MTDSDLLLGFGERLIAGLQRKAVTTPSRWAQEYVKNFDGTPTSYRRYPWQREMMDSTARHNLAAKGAQLGISHVALMRGCAANLMEHRDVLYVLPSMNPTGNDFSTARFDAMVNASPTLLAAYDKANVGHKRCGPWNFYIRGGQSRAGGKSVPAGFLVLDEINEIGKEFVVLVRERMSGQDIKTEWDISTPTVPEHGISKLWDESSQEHFFFPCPGCRVSGPDGVTRARMIELTYPECLQIVGDDPDSARVLSESYLKCKHCGVKIEHASKADLFEHARFVPTVAGKEKRGFHVNQMYSATVTPGEMAAAAIRAELTEVDAQEFWNSKMGMAHRGVGAALTDELIEACKGDHLNLLAPSPARGTLRTMGADVGAWIHFEVDEWYVDQARGADVNSYAVPKILRAGRARSFDELDSLMRTYGIRMAVVDAQPDTRAAFAFSQRWPLWVKLCYFAQGTTGRILTETRWQNGEPVINVNRSAWLDQALNRFRPGFNGKPSILIPRDVPFEFIEHLKAPSRMWKRDKHGNPTVVWVTPDGKQDHHAFSRCYAEIALPLAMGTGVARNVASPID